MDANSLDARLIDQLIYRASQEERLAIARKAIEALTYGAASRGESRENLSAWSEELTAAAARLRNACPAA